MLNEWLFKEGIKWLHATRYYSPFVYRMPVAVT